MIPTPAKNIAYVWGSGTTPAVERLNPIASDPVPASPATMPNTRFPVLNVDVSPNVPREYETSEFELQLPPPVKLLKLAFPLTEAVSKGQHDESLPVKLMV